MEKSNFDNFEHRSSLSPFQIKKSKKICLIQMSYTLYTVLCYCITVYLYYCLCTLHCVILLGYQTFKSRSSFSPNIIDKKCVKSINGILLSFKNKIYCIVYTKIASQNGYRKVTCKCFD